MKSDENARAGFGVRFEANFYACGRNMQDRFSFLTTI
jgi:hypothetical protein